MAQRNRVAGLIDPSQTVVLAGHVPAKAQARYDQGPVDSSFLIQGLTLLLKPSAEQQNALDTLLSQQQDPSSPLYRQWLTPAEFADRFAPSPADIGQITSWMQAQGFSITAVSPTRNWVAFNATAQAIRDSLRTEIHRYVVDGETHYANASDPVIPAALAEITGGFRGLDNFLLKAPRSKLVPTYTVGANSHYLAPEDVATIYDLKSLYTSGIDGTGQKLVVVGQTDVNVADITSFRSMFNLPTNNPQMRLVPGYPDPGTSSGDLVEADLDLEWSGALAPKATVIYVYSNNVMNSVQYAISANVAPVIAMSYGGCEIGEQAAGLAMRTMAQQAIAQGITWVAASGDSGAAGCDEGVATHGPAVILPASIPEVTAVGGTTFNEGSSTSYWSSSNDAGRGSALSYIPEVAWNDSAVSNGSTGGGVSVIFSKPSWQAGPGVPGDGARDVPDVSLSASAVHDGALICTGGSCSNGQGSSMVVGGTSYSAQVFAAIVSLANQHIKTGLGNINPVLYTIGQGSTASTVFHDITSGSNIVPCKTGSTGCTSGSFGYSAGPGYDRVTGLGSVDGHNLVMSSLWTSAAPKPPAVAVQSVTISPAQVMSGSIAAVTVTLNGAAPTGGAAVTLTGGSAAFPVPSPVTVAAGQSSLTLNVTAGTVSAATSATISASAGGASASVSVTVMPVAPAATLSSVTVNPSTVSGGNAALVTYTFTQPLPAAGTISISSSDPHFPLRSVISVAKGVSAGSVSVQTVVVTASTTVTVTAVYNGVTKTANVTLTPVVATALSSISLSPGTLQGPGAVNLTVNLTGPAPAGGTLFTMTSSAPAIVTVPQNVLMPAGMSSGSIRLTAQKVTANTSVTITATSNGVTKSATVTVTH